MAGAGYKLFNTGDVLTAAQVNTYLMEQTVMVFADAAARTTALTGIVSEGMISYLKDTNAVEVYNGSAWVASDDPNAIQNTIVDAKGDLITATAADTPARLAVGSNGDTLVADSAQSTGLRYNPPVGSLANPVINGGMDVWQRGTSISVSASSSPYIADRWQITTQTNQACTVSRQATGDTTNLPNLQYSMRVQRNSGQTGTNTIQMGQSFETTNSIPFAGKTVTVSFYARRGANYSASSNVLGIDFISGTGTDQNRLLAGYTGNANVFSQSATLTTTWQRFAFTGTVAAATTEFAILFLFAPTGTAGADDWYEVTGVQIDVGTWTASTAPTFRRSGGTLQGELAACQRYYWRIDNSSLLYKIYGMGTANSTTVATIPVPFPVRMRVVPTTLEYSTLWLYDGNSGWNITSLVQGTFDSTELCGSLRATVASGLTQFRPYILSGANSGSAFLAFGAEL
jgi:hypothetical protein